MAPEKILKEQKIVKKSVLKNQQSLDTSHQGNNTPTDLFSLQKIAGNRAVQRLVVQKLNSGSGELDEETIDRINQERGQGQPLENSVQSHMSQALGMDFSHVDVHTSQQSHNLNRQLNAKAFTTGKDIFFREGEYQPHTSSGQNLIAHELTHVVQQSSGQIPAGDSMRVNPPDDAFEKQADSYAKQITTTGNASEVQKQAMPEEEEEIQEKSLQRQEVPEEEEEL